MGEVGETDKMHFLVVDDSTTSRLIAKNNLSKGFDCKILEAEDGSQGFELANKDQFDLIVTDYNMPHLDGLEMIDKIRKESPLNGKTPIILVSAYLDELPMDTSALHNVLFIKKPVPRPTLIRHAKMAMAMKWDFDK